MTKRIYAMISCALIILLSGCGKDIYPPLEPDATAFEYGVFEDEDNDNASYITIEYNGRVYMPYGVVARTIHEEDIDKCIGYIVRGYNDDKDSRVYTLADDKDNNYLMEYYVGTSLMNQPNFLRAVDTKGMEIYTPNYIDSLEYEYWE